MLTADELQKLSNFTLLLLLQSFAKLNDQPNVEIIQAEIFCRMEGV